MNMKIFRDYTFTWWQAGIFKLCLLLVGIAIGANWSGIFVQYTALFIVISVILGIYIASVSFKK